MANSLLTLYKERLLDLNRGGLSGVDVNSDTIKAALVSSSYTPNLATHEFWSSAVANVVGTPQTLTSVTVTGGAFGAASPITYTAVTGAQVNYVIFFKDTGTTTTSPMLAIFDTATGLPVTPNGGNITVSLNASGIFSF